VVNNNLRRIIQSQWTLPIPIWSHHACDALNGLPIGLITLLVAT